MCSVQISVFVVFELVLMHKIFFSLLWPTCSRRQCFTTIGAASLWDRSLTCSTCECRSPTDSRDDNPKGAKVSALEWQLWRSSRDVARKLRLVPANGRRKLSWRWILSLPRHAERKSFLRHSSSVDDILQTAATLTYCKQDLCTQNSVGRRSEF
jgi:hypothetical protein